MDTNFLSNPANTAMLTGLCVIIAGMVFYLLNKKNLSYSKENGLQMQTAEQSMTKAIPRIDEHMKEKLRAMLNDNKDRVLGTLNDFPPIIRALIINKIFEEIRERIFINHFASILSNKQVLDDWVLERVDSSHRKLIYLFDYCEIADVDFKLLDEKLFFIYSEFMDLFSERVIDACYDKISAYGTYSNDSKCKKLVAKNEEYIDAIRTTLSQRKKRTI